MEKENSLAVILEKQKKAIQLIAPKYVNAERLIALALEAKMRNPKLAKCSPESVINFCKKCAEAGTDRIGAGGMWAVPFFNKKTSNYDMTPIPDWRLIVEKASSAKVIKTASAKVVHEKDQFEFEYGLNPQLIHKPNLADPGKCIAAYCIITFPDNTKDFTVMNLEEIESIKKRSKTSGAGPWVTDFEEMARKTVIKRALKIFEGSSPELTKVLAVDNSSMGFVDITSSEPIKEPEAIKEPKIINVTPPEEKEKVKKKEEKKEDVKETEVKKEVMEQMGWVKQKSKNAKILTEEEEIAVKPRGKDADIHPITEAQLKALKKITTKLGLDEKGISKFIKEFFEDAEIGTLESLTSAKAAELINELQ